MQGAGLGESNNAKQRLRVQLQDPKTFETTQSIIEIKLKRNHAKT
jgi:hypothetical protein